MPLDRLLRHRVASLSMPLLDSHGHTCRAAFALRIGELGAQRHFNHVSIDLGIRE